MEWLTVEEAAIRTGLSIATVRRRAGRGEITAQKSGKQWLIDGDKLSAGRRATRGSTAASPTFDLHKALRHVTSKDLSELWVPDVLRFEDYLAASDVLLAGAADRLQDRDADPAIEVSIAKTPFFTRAAVLLTLEDRVAYQAAVASIAQKIDAALSPQVGSARLSKDDKYFLQRGQTAWQQWVKSVREEVRGGKRWMIKSDLTVYFDHVPHRLLLEEISALNPEPRLLPIIRKMLRSWASVPDLGLPQGPNASRVLANLYLLPVDRAMLNAGFSYYRYMDDFRVVASTKAEVVDGMRLLEQECRRRGLILSTAKTSLLEGDEALRDGQHPERDEAQYWSEMKKLQNERRSLRKILADSLREDGHIDVSGMRFSMWRLARIREYSVLRRILPRLEDLAPVASVVAAYLRFFVMRDYVVSGVADFLEDEKRANSSFLVTWLLAAMLERPGPAPLPDRWTRIAERRVKDRNQPAYLRAVAAVVFARGRRPADLAWIKTEVAREYDPVLMRGYAVALYSADSLDKAIGRTLAAKSSVMANTVEYLSGRTTLPSLVYLEGSLPVR